MSEPIFVYRMWQRGTEWHWQVLLGKNVLVSGFAEDSVVARASAMRYCLEHEMCIPSDN
jgi:hypothetical protein